MFPKLSDMESDWYKKWATLIGQGPIEHRKQWEYFALLEELSNRNVLFNGAKGAGFGVANEPVIPALVHCGCKLMVGDYFPSNKFNSQETKHHLHALNDSICSWEQFDESVLYENVDMNKIPDHYTNCDFVWSCCSLEHIGGLEKSKQFIVNSLRCLKPTGIAVHTTEFNLSSSTDTIDFPDLCAFRVSDLEDVAQRTEEIGWSMVPIEYNLGNSSRDWGHISERSIPTETLPHTKIRICGFTLTSILLTFLPKA